MSKTEKPEMLSSAKPLQFRSAKKTEEPVPALESDLSPEEQKAITSVAMEDAVTNPAAEVVPVPTDASLERIQQAYRDAEAQLKKVHPGSCHLRDKRHADLLIWHDGRINISPGPGLRMMPWDNFPTGIQAEQATHIPALIALVTKHGLDLNARIAANASKL